MDAQSGVRLKGKQVIQIPFQAQIRASQLLVRVVRFARFFVDRPLVEKALIRLKPGLQGVLKAHLKQGLPSDAVHQHHHAEIPPEIGGVHDDVGFFRQRVALPGLHTTKAAVDGLATASVLRGKLCRGLFSCAIGCPELVVLQALAATELPAAVVAFVALLTIAPPVLFDLF